MMTFSILRLAQLQFCFPVVAWKMPRLLRLNRGTLRIIANLVVQVIGSIHIHLTKSPRNDHYLSSTHVISGFLRNRVWRYNPTSTECSITGIHWSQESYMSFTACPVSSINRATPELSPINASRSFVNSIRVYKNWRLFTRAAALVLVLHVLHNLMKI